MSAPFKLCMNKYERRVPWIGHTVDFACQFPKGHDGRCSWAPLRDADELATKPPVEEVSGDLTIMDLLTAIDAGEFDPYLENILAVAHERKRELRGRRTYPPLKR